MSLKNLAIKGSLWTILGLGSGQFLRFVSNLILTRLLFPEVFGLSALINTFMLGLQMFSDLGIGASIIQNRRGDDPVFLNTAWTVSVFRGFFLWFCSLIFALPFANFYNEPQLKLLIMVSALTAVISGFNSTALFTYNRNIQLKAVIIIEIGAQFCAACIMIVWALISPTVWVVVVGGIVSAFVKMCASHMYLQGVKPKFTLDKESLKSLTRFGKWIFFSTLLTFVLNNADRLILGKLMTMGELGVFSIALMLSRMVLLLYNRLSQRVLFPLYTKVKDLPANELRKKVNKIRLAITSCLVPVLLVLVVFGDDFIKLVYDARYVEAGWMLQVLACGLIPVVLVGIGPFYLSLGKSNIQTLIVGLKGVFYFLSVGIGYYFFGSKGVIYGSAIHNVFVYIINVYLMKRYSILDFRIDLFWIIISTAFLYLMLLR